MEIRYFYTRQVDLLEDISRKLGNESYYYLSEVTPQSIEQVPLSQIGIWLQIDELDSQFSSTEFLLSVENRLKELGKYEWSVFNEITGIPDTKQIKPPQIEAIVGLIYTHLTEHDWGEENMPTDPRDQLRKMLFGRSLHNEVCGLLNQFVLHESKIWRATNTVKEDNPFTMAHVKFHLCVTNLIEAWFERRQMALPSWDEHQPSETKQFFKASVPREEEIRRNEERVKTQKIIQLSRENKALRAIRGIPSAEAMKAHIDESRKKNDKVNLHKLGERLGIHRTTAKRWIEKLNLSTYAGID